MDEAAGATGRLKHDGHHWGAMAADPWADIVPDSAAWRDAVRRAWLRDGGSEADFVELFGAPHGPATAGCAAAPGQPIQPSTRNQA